MPFFNSSVTVAGGRVIVNGRVLKSDDFEELPKVNESYENIRYIEIDGFDIDLEPGEVFKAVGEGYVKNRGNRVSVESFSGTLTIPAEGELEIKINSGTIRGQVNESSNVNLKVNAGDATLNLRNREKPFNLESKVNAGNLTVNVI